MVGLRLLDVDSESNARMIQGLIGGLGFLGGGAILKSNGTVKGMATAATIWCAGAVGAASAYSQWEVAITLMVGTLITLQFGTEVKKAVNGRDDDEERPNCD